METASAPRASAQTTALEAPVPDRSVRPGAETFEGATFPPADVVPPFERTNPTAELVARHVAEEVAGALPAGVRLGSVSIGEAPGCEAIYRPDMQVRA
jgi:hypothetical protein